MEARSHFQACATQGAADQFVVIRILNTASVHRASGKSCISCGRSESEQRDRAIARHRAFVQIVRGKESGTGRGGMARSCGRANRAGRDLRTQTKVVAHSRKSCVGRTAGRGEAEYEIVRSCISCGPRLEVGHANESRRAFVQIVRGATRAGGRGSNRAVVHFMHRVRVVGNRAKWKRRASPTG
jgi:hypothetical protein